MGTCVTQREWLRLVAKERADLARRKAEGEDIDEALADLELLVEAREEMHKEKAQAVVKNRTPLSVATINELNRGKLKYKGMDINIVNGYRTDEGDIMAYVRNRAGKMYNVNAYMIDSDMHIVTDEILYGNKEGKEKIDWKSYTQDKTYIHGNVDTMLAMIDKMQSDGSNKESNAHLEVLRDLVKQMKPEFFEKVSLFLKQTANDSSGVVAVDVNKYAHKLGVSISGAPATYANRQSDAEIYVHEVVHTMIAFAMNSEDVEATRLRRELNHVMQRMIEKTTWKDFLPETSMDAVKEEKEAKKMYNYIFTSENAEHEFMAHVLTNPLVMQQAKKVMISDHKKAQTLFQKVMSMFATLVDIVLGKYEFKQDKSTAHEQVLGLALKLGEINNRYKAKTDKESLLTRGLDKFNELDTRTGEILDNFLDKYLRSNDEMKAKPDGGLALAKWRAEALVKMATNPNYQKYGKLLLSALGAKPWGMIQNILSDFGTPDETERVATWMNLAADRIDAARMSMIGAVKRHVYSKFKELNKEQEVALTRVVLDTDLGTLLGDKYTPAKIKELLTDDAKLHTEIGRAKHRLRELDKANGHWHVNQATGLGYYMATHKAHVAQNLNSFNIARGLISNVYKQPTRELVRAIDEVATLVALENTDTRQKRTVAGLMDSDKEGVLDVMKLHVQFDKDARKTLFENSKTHMIKGYSREVFDDSMSMEIAPQSEETELMKLGYKKVKDFTSIEEDGYTEPMAMYISNSFSTGERLRTAVRLTKLGSKGTSLSDIMYAGNDDNANTKRDIVKLRLDKKRIKLVNDMYKGELDPKTVEYGISPIMDEDGNITDYRFMMDKESKEDFLKQDATVSEVLARSYGHSLDKARTMEHNEKVLKTILDDMEVNYVSGSTLGNNGLEYIEVGPDVHNAEMKELYRLLPASFKKAIAERKDKVLAVRGDLLLTYFGYKHASLSNIAPKFTPTMIRTAVRIAEAMWIEFIKIVKTNVLLKIPSVFVTNILSNMAYALETGMTPVEIVKMYTESYRDISAYIEASREINRLTLKLGVSKDKRADETKIKLLTKQLVGSPVHELFELGLYSAINEDVDNAEVRSTNRWKRAIDDKVRNVPDFIKVPLQWAYLSEETAYYKFTQEILQKSDLIARDVANRKLKREQELKLNGKLALNKSEKTILHTLMEKEDLFSKRQLDEASERITESGIKLADYPRAISKFREEFDSLLTKERQFALAEMFVLYNKPSSNKEEWLNRVGAVLFTKYPKRIQKIISQGLVTHPLKAMLVLAGQGMLLDSVESIHGQSLFIKDWSNVIGSPLKQLETGLGMSGLTLMMEGGYR